MIVEICKEQALWDAYVNSNAKASNYHRWVWKDVIRDTFGHKAYYLIARSGQGICGVLPLFSIRSRLFGRSLVSVPFFSYGGVLADDNESCTALLNGAADIARETGARHIELRQGSELDAPWQTSAAKVTMEISLPASPDEYWKRLSSGMRNKIRAGRKNGFQMEWGGIELVSTFFPIFATNMRNLGTPVYPFQWFENQCRYNPETIRILILRDRERTVAGAFLSAFRDTLELPWSASLPEYRKKYAPVLMYWTFLEWAMQNGFRKVDLGRCTPGSGTHEFKTHWQCAERPLPWYYWLGEGSSIPNLRPENGRYRLAVEMWKRLPLFLANGLGPRIVRGIP